MTNSEPFKMTVIPMSAPIEEHIRILLGPPDLTEASIPYERASSNDKEKLQSTLATVSKNPYVRAREEILKKMPKAKRTEIEQMEAMGKVDNRVYKEFLAAVANAGDKLSS